MIAKVLSRIGIEVWKDIPEFEGIYQVSNLGNVKSIRNNKIKILSKHIQKQKYNHKSYAVSFYVDKKSKSYKVHKLVAIAFLNHKPCGYKLVIDHIDNDSLNNRLYNLQEISQRKNTSKDKKGTSKYTGVYWCKKNKRWHCSIYTKQKRIFLGRFKDEKKAAEAYKNELKKINESKSTTL